MVLSILSVSSRRPSRRPSSLCRASNPLPQLAGLLGAPGGFPAGELRPRSRRTLTDGSPAVFEEGVDGALGYEVPAPIVLVGLQLPAVDHLPDAAVGDPEDARDLAGGVGVLFRRPVAGPTAPGYTQNRQPP